MCSLCGSLLARPGESAERGPAAAGAERGGSAPEPLQLDAPASCASIGGLPAHWFHLLLGALLAPLLALPFASMFAWFLGALCHESGHTVVAWVFGMPAYPAIRLDGHAASMHQEQKLVLVVALWVGLACWCWRRRHSRRVRPWLIVAALLYPALALTRGRELLQLLGGHLGELAFATICFWRTLSGGFTQSRAERAAYALVGWHLTFANARLCLGLMLDPARREAYASNGSFGLTNDYIRVAEDVLGCSVPAVAAGMLLAALAAFPLAYVIWRVRPE